MSFATATLTGMNETQWILEVRKFYESNEGLSEGPDNTNQEQSIVIIHEGQVA